MCSLISIFEQKAVQEVNILSESFYEKFCVHICYSLLLFADSHRYSPDEPTDFTLQSANCPRGINSMFEVYFCGMLNYCCGFYCKQ